MKSTHSTLTTGGRVPYCWTIQLEGALCCECICVFLLTLAETSRALDEPWYLTPLSLFVCARWHMCTFIFRVPALWRGQARVPKDFNGEGHSSNSKYVSTVHPSLSGWQLCQTHRIRSATTHAGMCPRHGGPEFICRHLLLNIAQQC